MAFLIRPVSSLLLAAAILISSSGALSRDIEGGSPKGKSLADLQKMTGLYNANQELAERMCAFMQRRTFTNLGENLNTLYLRDSVLIQAMQRGMLKGGVHTNAFLEKSHPEIQDDQTYTPSSYRWKVTGPDDPKQWDPVTVADLELNSAENVPLGSKTAAFDFTKADFRLFYRREVGDVVWSGGSKELDAKPAAQTATIVIRDPQTRAVTMGYQCQLDVDGNPVVSSISKLDPNGAASNSPPDAAFQTSVAVVFKQAFAETLEKAATTRNDFVAQRAAFLKENPHLNKSGNDTVKP